MGKEEEEMRGEIEERLINEEYKIWKIESENKFLAFENLEMHIWFALNGFLCQLKINF